MVAQIRVKCEKCGREFIRYIYKRHSSRHKFRRHQHHRGGAPCNPMDSCYYCNGQVKQILDPRLQRLLDTSVKI